MTVLVLLLLLLLLVGTSVYLALGVVSLAAFVTDGHAIPGLAQLILDRMNSGTLVAIPFFVVAATFMQKSRAAHALIQAANAWVGHLPGGLAIVCVTAATIFSAISGSSTATALALGTILIPAMRKRHYQETFATAVVGASATLGILIPPSLALIIYGVISGESIPRLFLAGVVPGLLLATIFSVYIVSHSIRQGLPTGSRPDFREFLRLQREGLPAALIPIVALGGIYSGILTVTEAAAASAVTAILLNIFVYNKERNNILLSLADSMKVSAAILLIVSFAFPFSHAIIVSQIPATFLNAVTGLDLGPIAFMLALSLIMLLLGTFLEIISVILITLPIVLPTIQALDINPIHYAVVVIVNMSIATLTPPIGLSLFVLSSLSSSSFLAIVRGTLPFLGLMCLLLLCVILFPALSLWLPDFLFN